MRDRILLVALIVFLVLMFWASRPRPPVGGKDIRQRAQLNSLETAVELFKNDFGVYPPSDANDTAGRPYAGAMKMVEALMGRDLLGFHPGSTFRSDGSDPNTHVPLYPTEGPSAGNLKVRRGPFVQVENANAFSLADIYGKGNTGPFAETAFVLCDTCVRKRPSGKETGMPILYYRAHPSRTSHDVNNPDNPLNIYDYKDNQALLKLGVPGEPNAVHPLADPKRFYTNIQNYQVVSSPQPWRRDSYILISAGYDGLYGTADDVCNFRWKYRER